MLCMNILLVPFVVLTSLKLRALRRGEVLSDGPGRCASTRKARERPVGRSQMAQGIFLKLATSCKGKSEFFQGKTSQNHERPLALEMIDLLWLMLFALLFGRWRYARWSTPRHPSEHPKRPKSQKDKNRRACFFHPPKQHLPVGVWPTSPWLGI